MTWRVLGLLLFASLCGCRPAALAPADAEADFDALWQFVRERYVYLGEKATDWDAVKASLRPRAARAGSRDALIVVLERALEELYDPHTHLGVNLARSWRLPPHDLWGTYQDGAALIEEVRAGSASAAAGLVAGMVVLRAGGEPIAQAVAKRRPRFLRRADPEADAWALNVVLAGQHDRDRVFEVRGAGRIRVADRAHRRAREPALSARWIAPGIGYVRIASFGDEGTVAAFDAALETFREARGLLFDVRDNPGGDTAVARPILGRLLTEKRPYAWMKARQGPRWAEHVDPRGPWAFRGRVAVLVNHFSMSMAEGFAMALDAIGRGTMVGTAMTGLGAAIERRELPRSKIAVQISAERIYHVDGTPREKLVPKVRVVPRAGGDAFVEAGLRVLETNRKEEVRR